MSVADGRCKFCGKRLTRVMMDSSHAPCCSLKCYENMRAVWKERDEKKLCFFCGEPAIPESYSARVMRCRICDARIAEIFSHIDNLKKNPFGRFPYG